MSNTSVASPYESSDFSDYGTSDYGTSESRVDLAAVFQTRIWIAMPTARSQRRMRSR